MANTYVDYTATAAQTDFNFSFPYLEDTHVEVSVDGISKTLTTDYTIETTPLRIVLVTPATSGVVVRIQRNSGPTIDLVDFVNGSVLTESALDRAYLHNRYLNEESFDGNDSSLRQISGGTDFNAASRRIRNVATPVDFTDAVNKNYIDEKLILGGTSLSGFSVSTHTGNGSLTEFTLSFTPQTSTASAFRVTVDGLVKTPTVDYTIGTTQITFTVAPSDTTSIVVVPLGTAQDVNSVGITATGSTTARSLSNRSSDVVSVKDYGAIGDGVTDDTNAIIAAAAALTSCSTLYFPSGVYLVSYQGTAFSSVYGNVIVDLNGLTDIALVGKGVTIKINNHNIGTNGGLRFANFKSCKRVVVEGFYFDLSYTGHNTSASHYPYGGAITLFDTTGAGQAFSTLNSDFIITHCSFKLYHPDGAFRSTNTPYIAPGGSADGNNGFKNFALYCSGPYQITPYESQCRNIAVESCIFIKGGNSYCVYMQAWNNVKITNNTFDGHISCYTDASGIMGKGAIPALRFQHYNSEGLLVQGNFYRVLPFAERTGAFAGSGYFLTSGTSDQTATEGTTIVSNNTIILGGNDSTRYDFGINVSSVGNFTIESNTFKVIDSVADQNIYKYAIFHSTATAINNASSTLLVVNNTFGPSIGGAGVTFFNGTTFASRPRRHLIVQGNTYRGGRALLDMKAGVQSAVITGNTIDGDGHTVPNDYTFAFQSRSIILSGMLSGADYDAIECYGNAIANTTYGIESPLKYPVNNTNLSSEDVFKIYNNSYSNVTYPTRYGVAITNATNVSPIVVTSTGNRLDTGDRVTIAGVLGNTAANGTFVITRVDANSFSLDGSTGNGAYTSGGTWEINRSRFQSMAFRTNNSTLTNNLMLGTDQGNPSNSGVDGISFNTSNIGGTINASSTNYNSLDLNRSGTEGTEDGDVVLLRRNAVSVGSISVSAGATAYNTSSDYRLKENVKELEDALERLKQLSVKRFNFTADPSKEVDGFIAHEVSAVVPEAINGQKDAVDEEGDPIYQGIDQSKLVPLLTAALKELTLKVEALENK